MKSLVQSKLVALQRCVIKNYNGIHEWQGSYQFLHKSYSCQIQDTTECGGHVGAFGGIIKVRIWSPSQIKLGIWLSKRFCYTCVRICKISCKTFVNLVQVSFQINGKMTQNQTQICRTFHTTFGHTGMILTDFPQESMIIFKIN